MFGNKTKFPLGLKLVKVREGAHTLRAVLREAGWQSGDPHTREQLEAVSTRVTSNEGGSVALCSVHAGAAATTSPLDVRHYTAMSQETSAPLDACSLPAPALKPLLHGTTLSAIRATVLLANRPRASTRTEISRY